MEKKFFDKYINISENEMIKGAIYSQCRIMDKEDIYNWIYEDELQLKKQQEIIDNAIEYINKMFSTGFYNDDYYLGRIKEILEDREV